MIIISDVGEQAKSKPRLGSVSCAQKIPTVRMIDKLERMGGAFFDGLAVMTERVRCNTLCSDLGHTRLPMFGINPLTQEDLSSFLVFFFEFKNGCLIKRSKSGPSEQRGY